MHRILTLENVGFAASAASALLVASLLIHREFRTPSVDAATRPRKVQDWRTYETGGHRLGPPTAPVQLVVFGDFQCPACAQLARAIDSAQVLRPGQLTVLERHFPLERLHPAAREAARLVECAADANRYEAAFHEVFASQATLIKRPWGNIAERIGLDSVALARCIRSPESDQRVARDIADGDRLGIIGTPVVLVDGKLSYGAIPLASLLGLIDSRAAR